MVLITYLVLITYFISFHFKSSWPQGVVAFEEVPRIQEVGSRERLPQPQGGRASEHTAEVEGAQSKDKEKELNLKNLKNLT